MKSRPPTLHCPTHRRHRAMLIHVAALAAATAGGFGGSALAAPPPAVRLAATAPVAQTASTRAFGRCAAQTLQWSANTYSCSAPAAAAESGATASLTDKVSPLTGSASFQCNKGIWSAPTAATCRPAPFVSIPMDTGGWFSGFASHASGRLYGFGDVFGTWRSDDSGQSWRYLQGDLTVDDNTVDGLSVAPKNADVVAFRTPTRLWWSTDGGTRWAPALSDLAVSGERVRGARPIRFMPDNDNEVLLAAPRSGRSATLWRSLDGGATWSAVGGSTFSAPAVATTIAVRPEFPDHIQVGTKQGLYVSADRGRSWALVPVPVRTQGHPQPVITSIVRRADGTGYFTAAGYIPGGGFNHNNGGYRLTATDWAQPATYRAERTVSWWDGWGPTNATLLADGSFVSGGDGEQQATATAADMKASQRISRDGGQTWTLLQSRLTGAVRPSWSPPITPSSYAPGGRDMVLQDPLVASRWYMTGGSAPVVSNDAGASWQYFPNTSGIAGVMTYKTRFASGNAGVALIPGSDKGVFVVTDGGVSGNVAGNSERSLDTLFTAHDAMSVDGRTIVAAGVDQAANTSRIERSGDGGASWTAMDLSASGLPASSEGITRSVMSPVDANDFLVLLGAGGADNHPGLWRTTNGGATFFPVSGLPTGLDTGARYHDENSWLERDGVSPNVRYFSARPASNGLYRSGDGGSSWARTASNPSGWAWIDCLAVDRATAGKLWVATSAGLHTSDDGGDRWTTISGFDAALQVDAAGGRVAVWGKRSGDAVNKLYYSADNGATWVEKTAAGHRFAFLKRLAVDPVVPGKVWVTGISAHTVN